MKRACRQIKQTQAAATLVPQPPQGSRAGARPRRKQWQVPQVQEDDDDAGFQVDEVSQALLHSSLDYDTFRTLAGAQQVG